ncbi:ABC transporter ATP-binding protein [Phycicoccus sp. BSK3Z-2]|uniref:ABC transporter ATP-binding protein n=1 Tax=Phycicoccus avicenniae TaxID=2828860 RepID=A0A941D646_9MICO|nr:ABC transporter ATP-binding protein [Phycicoccus avicenniae]MBR7742318.1 ABC transporter ATP-binding protein [Phycicoccus avicenniae]
MHPSLDAVGVTFRFAGADAPALDDVSLRVDPGEYVALLGPNGAGKTTLIGMVTGLRVPDRGTVRVCGGDPTSARTRLRLGAVLQDTAFPRHLTVRELVEGAAVRSGVPRGRAAGVLEEVGLDDLARRRSGKLSGGQRRRLQLARALVADPALLVLDEPTEGLDAAARRDFWRNLTARRDAGMAVLLTTHIVEEAGAVADRVSVIAGGRVVADESPASLTGRLADRTVSVRTALPAAVVRDLPGVLRVEETAGRLVVVTTSPEAVVRRVLHDDPTAHDLRVEAASLEEAVMAATDRMSA